MTKKLLLTAACLALAFTNLAKAQQEYDVAAYYWPAYHPDPLWQSGLGVFKDGIAEWEAIRDAQPRYKGHDQPKIPTWGFEDESKPEVMEKKIEAAAKYGVNIFIFDWYWYNDKPFLEAALDDGFLKAKNKDKIKFFVMWANHDVNDVWDHKKPVKELNKNIIWKAATSLDVTKKIFDRTIEKYFKQSNYYKIDGKPVYSIYQLSTFIEGVGGVENAKKALDYFREKSIAAGFAGVHIQTICWNLPKGLEGVPGDDKPSSDKIVTYLGIDSFTSYQWIHNVGAGGLHYKDWGNLNVAKWDGFKKDFTVPYFAHVAVGWDNNPRWTLDIFRPMVMAQSPIQFEKFLRDAKAWTDKNYPKGPKLITINSWNEWSEGSYLEPDYTFGYGYLEAVRRVFKE